MPSLWPSSGLLGPYPARSQPRPTCCRLRSLLVFLETLLWSVVGPEALPRDLPWAPAVLPHLSSPGIANEAVKTQPPARVPSRGRPRPLLASPLHLLLPTAQVCSGGRNAIESAGGQEK